MKMITIIAILFYSFQSMAATQNPTELLLKPSKVAVSTSPLCTNLQTILTDSSPSYVDFLQSPTVGNAQLADGTYPCIVIEVSNKIKYNPTSTAGDCVAGTEYTLDICQNTQVSNLIDGSSVTCDGTTEKTIALYISTGSTWTTGAGDPFQAPTSIGDASHGIKLNSALVVSGTSSAKFVVNGTGKLDDTAGGNSL